MSQDRSMGEVLGKISAVQLAQIWKSKFGLDVERFFLAPEILLEPVSPYGYYRFRLAKPGDLSFYSQLMRRMGYEAAEKAEFREAAREITPHDKVLDVGCGTGNFSVRCPGAYRGIDTNPTAVEDGIRMGRNVNCAFLQNEEPDSYDVVTLFQVLEHVDDPVNFLKACVACLRPGGQLIVSTPNMNGIMGWVSNDVLNYPPHHMSWWSPLSLQAIITDIGCELVRTWEQPLQRTHLQTALNALFWPRDETHLTSSLGFRFVGLGTRLLAHFASSKWQDGVPFIKGHTVMIVARKMEAGNSSQSLIQD